MTLDGAAVTSTVYVYYCSHLKVSSNVLSDPRPTVCIVIDQNIDIQCHGTRCVYRHYNIYDSHGESCNATR